jgi:hypothetical protein
MRPGGVGYRTNREKILSEQEHDYVDVHGDARIVYVLVAKREKFDEIPLPAVEHDNRAENRSHLLTKTLDSTDLKVVFQHWLDSIDHTPATQIAGR